MQLDTVPCKTCGEPTTYTGTKQCNDCHEVEIRLGGYLRRGGASARAFVLSTLKLPNFEEMLTRLKGRLKRERTICNKIYESSKDPVGKERARGEATVLSKAIRLIGEDLKELKGK